MDLPQRASEILEEGVTQYPESLFTYGFRKGFKYFYEHVINMDIETYARLEAETWFTSTVFHMAPKEELYSTELVERNGDISILKGISDEYARVYWNKVEEIKQEIRDIFKK